MSEIRDYRKFTMPAELHKAINTLRGLVAGISADTAVGDSEIAELAHWCELQAHLRDRHPFSELIPVVEEACADGVVTSEEAQNILWLCNNFTATGTYYNDITSSIQFLAGLLHGMLADNELADKEILALQNWVNANDFLKGTYPFDEIESLLCDILADGVITAEEKERLMAFMSNIVDFTQSLNLNEFDFAELRKKYSVDGICAVCPEITFEGKTFVITGESYRASRAEIKEKIESFGGVVRSAVSVRTDYLVVGDAGNPCWAYACYGRKIEEAEMIRREGGRVVIVNENDLWDAMDDIAAGIV